MKESLPFLLNIKTVRVPLQSTHHPREGPRRDRIEIFVSSQLSLERRRATTTVTGRRFPLLYTFSPFLQPFLLYIVISTSFFPSKSVFQINDYLKKQNLNKTIKFFSFYLYQDFVDSTTGLVTTSSRNKVLLLFCEKRIVIFFKRTKF